jgi:hypothetical protein
MTKIVEGILPSEKKWFTTPLGLSFNQQSEEKDFGESICPTNVAIQT